MWYTTLRLNLWVDTGSWNRYWMTASKIREGSDDSDLPTMAARCSFGTLIEKGFSLLPPLPGTELLPGLAGLLGLTSSHASSCLTTLSCPKMEAAKIGIWPSLSGLLGLRSSSVSSSLTTL